MLKPRKYYLTAGIIFALVAILHTFRVVNGLELRLGSFLIPAWFSVLAVLVAGYMAYRGFQLSKKK